jgi:hypothetical protein
LLFPPPFEATIFVLAFVRARPVVFVLILLHRLKTTRLGGKSTGTHVAGAPKMLVRDFGRNFECDNEMLDHARGRKRDKGN